MKSSSVFLVHLLQQTYLKCHHLVFCNCDSILYCRLSFYSTACLFADNICLRSSDLFYVVTYYIKWVTTSWTHSTSYDISAQNITKLLQITMHSFCLQHLGLMRGKCTFPAIRRKKQNRGQGFFSSLRDNVPDERERKRICECVCVCVLFVCKREREKAKTRQKEIFVIYYMSRKQ